MIVDKLYQVMSYENQYTLLMVISRYLVLKEYIVLSMTDQKTLEIAFAVITPPRDNLKLCIDARLENPPHQSSHSSLSGFFPHNPTLITTKAECLMRNRYCEVGKTPSCIVEAVLTNNISLRPVSSTMSSRGLHMI